MQFCPIVRLLFALFDAPNIIVGMKPALIFDLDGTLWDSSGVVAESWNEVGRRYYGDSYFVSSEEVRGLMGKTMVEIANYLLPENAGSEAERFTQECFSYEITYLGPHPGSLFPNELEVLKKLACDYRLFIVSNCQNGYIENFLPLVPADLFEGFMCFGDTHKPKNVTIRALMKKFGVEKAAYIGDTVGDEKATRLAEIPFIHAAYGYGTCENPDASAESFEDLLVKCPQVLPIL